MTKLICIAGPTGAGKTALAIELAKRINGELVGADSVQIYRGFDVGSSKPKKDELCGIPHHLIDIASPDDPFDAMYFVKRADSAIEDIQARGKVPIVVGGTGLWIRALLRGLVDVPDPDPVIRARLSKEADELGSAALYARLLDIDPISAKVLHPNDSFRIVRALEVFEQTGKPLGELRQQHAGGALRYNTWFAALEVPIGPLSDQLDRRVRAMLTAGWIDEVKLLLAQYGSGIRGLKSVGYAQVVDHLEGRVSLADLPSLITRITRRYALRQRTWFRGERDVTIRCEPSSFMGEHLKATEAFLSRSDDECASI